MEAIFASATPHSRSIARPSCSQCGTRTALVGIEPERAGYELHTFQCPKCAGFETAVGKAAWLAADAEFWEGQVRLTPAQCQQYAEECIAMAERAGPENTASLHRMAQTWLELAEQLLIREQPVPRTDQNAPSTEKIQ